MLLTLLRQESNIVQYPIGRQFSNGFTIISTPNTKGNNTGNYLVANSVAFQYYVSLAEIESYNFVGNNNNGSGGSAGSGSSSSGSTSSSTTAAPPGSPFIQIPASTSIGYTVVSPSSGSMVRLINVSSYDQTAIVVGHDNSSMPTGPILFAQQMAAGQVIDITELTTYGIVVSVVGAALNGDGGINVVNDTGGNAMLTGFPWTTIPVSTTGTVNIASTSGYCIALLNNSQTDQSCLITGFDNASTTSGRILFSVVLERGQRIYLGEQTSYGITVSITNGSTNSDYGVNVIHA